MVLAVGRNGVVVGEARTSAAGSPGDAVLLGSASLGCRSESTLSKAPPRPLLWNWVACCAGQL